MNKEILRSVLADNQVEIPRHDVIPRKFEFEEFGNYVFVGIRRAGKSYLLYQRIQQLLSSGTGWDEILSYIIHSGFISGYQNRYGDNLKPPTNVYHRMTA